MKEYSVACNILSVGWFVGPCHMSVGWLVGPCHMSIGWLVGPCHMSVGWLVGPCHMFVACGARCFSFVILFYGCIFENSKCTGPDINNFLHVLLTY